MRFPIPSLDIVVRIAVGATATVAVVMFAWLMRPHRITVANDRATIAAAVGPITGLPCDDSAQRPIAVMLASDPEARPLSGLDGADIVFEMPVTPNGITRMMAVYQCGQDPKEIGSIRSARQDFIPLAQGLGAIFAHWGGEHDALQQLNNHIIDNVNALLYEGTTFYRKKGVPAPHDGSSTLKLIREKSSALGYVASSSTPIYPHRPSTKSQNLATQVDTASVNWPQGMDVRFSYDPSSNTYLRSRGGKPEMDGATGRQVRVSVVGIMQTDASFIRDQYIHVRTVGKGTVTIYQDGGTITGTWIKDTPTDALEFRDSRGKPILLSPGPIWVAIDAPLPQP